MIQKKITGCVMDPWWSLDSREYWLSSLDCDHGCGLVLNDWNVNLVSVKMRENFIYYYYFFLQKTSTSTRGVNFSLKHDKISILNATLQYLTKTMNLQQENSTFIRFIRVDIWPTFFRGRSTFNSWMTMT